MSSRLGLKARFHKTLRSGLHNLALSIAKHPKIYTFIPLALTALCSLGMLNAHLSHDIEWLFTGQGTRMDNSYQMFKHFFEAQRNASEFLPGRSLDVKAFVRVLVMAKDRERPKIKAVNVLDENPYEEILEIDRFLKDLSSKCKLGTCSYEQLCAKTKGECLQNPAIQVNIDYYLMEPQDIKISQF